MTSKPIISNEIFRHGVGKTFNLRKKFLIVSQHPVTTEYDKAFHQITNTLKAVKKLICPLLFCGLMLMRDQMVYLEV